MVVYLSVTSFVASIVASVFAGYIAYKNYIEKARIVIYTGGRMTLVSSSKDQLGRIHLDCSIANRGAKLGLINGVVLTIHSPPLDEQIQLSWHSFHRYEGEDEPVFEENTHSIMVKGKDSVFKRIEFLTEQPIQWKVGNYKFELSAWFNERDISSLPNFQSIFFADLNQKMVRDLSKRNSTSQYFPVPIVH